MKCLYVEGWSCRLNGKDDEQYIPSVEFCELCLKARKEAQHLRERKFNFEQHSKRAEDGTADRKMGPA